MYFTTYMLQGERRTSKMNFFLYILLAIARVQASHIVLHNENPRVNFYWQINKDHITYSMVADVVGWIGVGFSQSGSMKSADMTIMTDEVNRYLSIGYEVPVLSQHQNLKVEEAGRNGTHSWFQVSRTLNSCDDSFKNSSTYLLWALDDSSTQLRRHMSKGVMRVNLFDDKAILTPPVTMDEVRVRNITTDAFNADKQVRIIYDAQADVLPGTSYECYGYDIGGMAPGYYLGYDVVDQGLVHHANLYSCRDEEYDAFMGKSLKRDCYGEMNACERIASWAKGVGYVTFPGMGASYKHSKNILEIHYENPIGRPQQHVTYMRLYVQRKPPPVLVGIFAIAAPLREIEIGAGTRKTVRVEFPASCMREVFSGVHKVLGIQFHGHMYAEQFRLRHFRGDVELPLLSSINRFDFNMQSLLYLEPKAGFVNVHDRLILEGVLDARQSAVNVHGSLSTNGEMVVAHFVIVPPPIRGYRVGSLTTNTSALCTGVQMEAFLHTNQSQYDFGVAEYTPQRCFVDPPRITPSTPDLAGAAPDGSRFMVILILAAALGF
jgi:hypothetical protein